MSLSCTRDIGSGPRAPARDLELWRRNALELDQVAVALVRVGDRLSVPLARVCHEIVAHERWRQSGMRRPDFAREYGLGPRWIADLGFLGGKLDELPELERALSLGRLSRSAAVAIARVATPESLGAWLELAARLNVRQLKQQVRRARQARSASPVPEHVEVESKALLEDDDEPAWVVRQEVPAAVRVAFDECRELFHAVDGRESEMSAFVEALVAEGEAGPERYEYAAPSPLQVHPESDTEAEDRLDRTGRWRRLDQREECPAALEPARELLARVEALGEVRGPQPDEKARALLIQLVAAEHDVLRVLGEVLDALASRRPFSREGRYLPYLDLGHYAAARLGISRSLAYQLARVAREVRGYPLIQAGYEAGVIPLHKVALALGVLAKHTDREELDEAWAERLSCASFKRLRDETAQIRRARVADRELVPEPLDDETWFAGIRREPGTCVIRLAHLVLQACRGPLEYETLRLTLPEDLARRFYGACFAREEKLREQLKELGGRDVPSPRAADLPLLAVQRFSRTHPGSIRGWGLLALLWEFATSWDKPRQGSKTSSNEIYERRGCRCSAPTCTARVVEDSHTEARGRGGSDELDNRDADCPFHHRQGIHGSLARRMGKAPLNTLWRLGVGAWQRWYRNELRIPDPEPTLFT